MEQVQVPGLAPLAIVQGQPWVKLPDDLYIPPDALEVFLETFEGPLDLLLYLIKRRNLDILHIPIAEITSQYMEYVELMKEVKLELAAEYLVMAATLMEIKSRMLLPVPETADEEEDPRAHLLRSLQEYERFKSAGEHLDLLPRLERDLLPAQALVDEQLGRVPPEVSLRELLAAFQSMLRRADLYQHHRIERESLSLRERMSRVLDLLQQRDFTPFSELFEHAEGRAGVVVTFLALLELLKMALIELVQADAYRPIHVRLA